MNDRPNIQIYIDRLILDGFSVPHAQRPVLQAAVEAELGRLLAEGGIGAELRSGGTVPSVPAPAIELSPDGNSTEWGQQIAQAVYQGLSS